MNHRNQIALLLAPVAALFLHAGAEAVSLDPALRVLLNRSEAGTADVLRAAGAGSVHSPIPRSLLQSALHSESGRLEVFLEASAYPGGEGVEAFALGPNWYAARVSPSALKRMIDAGTIQSARLSRPMRSTLDRSGLELGIRRIHRQSQDTGAWSGTTGKGVVLGVVDSGVDWEHPDFGDGNGKTRIHRIWDQGYPFSAPPPGYAFGADFTDTDIDRGLANTTDSNGHGTHVLGIAAGNGQASALSGLGPTYAGMAPEASIVVVKTNFTEFGVALGVRYIFEQAAKLGMPAVVNLSLGNHFGPHRGTTPFEAVLEEMIGPGRLVVSAAGNDAHRGFHAEVRDETIPQVLRFSFPRYQKSEESFRFLSIEGWFDPRNRYRFELLSPSGEIVATFVHGETEREIEDVRGIIRGWYTEDLDLGTIMIDIEDDPRIPRLASGDWGLRIVPLESHEDPELDFWIVNWSLSQDSALPTFLDHVDPEESLVVPATARNVLAVGAVATRSCWTNTAADEVCYPTPPQLGAVAFFSAMGPTSDGRRKPEILAPGYGVVSTRSQNISPQSWSDEELARRSTPDELYWVNQGTSMAAPHVAGLVALLLQRHPELTFDQLVGRFQAGSETVLDQRTEEAVSVVRAIAVAPLVDLALSEAVSEAEGLRLRWFVGKERAPVQYRVYKGFSDQGPFHVLADTRITGDNPFEVLDRALEQGRPHVYRIAAIDGFGLEDDLDTLRTTVAGTPRFLMRAPDPNPTADRVNLRYYLPATAGGGRLHLDVVDISGRHVARLETDQFGPGEEERVSEWNLEDGMGRRVSSGVYLVRLAYQEFSAGGVSPSASTRQLIRRVVVLPN